MQYLCRPILISVSLYLMFRNVLKMYIYTDLAGQELSLGLEVENTADQITFYHNRTV